MEYTKKWLFNKILESRKDLVRFRYYKDKLMKLKDIVYLFNIRNGNNKERIRYNLKGLIQDIKDGGH